jgi:hypothetical protein
VTDNKTPADRLLDLFVYAPIGLLMNLDEVVPQLVERGRQQVTMARTFGQFAVQAGGAEAQKRVGKLQQQVEGVVEQIGGQGSRGSAPTTPRASTNSNAATPAAETPVHGEPLPVIDAPPMGDLAITDYDSLSASQVVPRLDGLSEVELDAVRRYEATNRGRKTILSKIAQLQGS